MQEYWIVDLENQAVEAFWLKDYKYELIACAAQGDKNVFSKVLQGFEVTLAEIFETYKLKVAILKYNGGNIQSVIFALNRLGIEPMVTDNAEEIASADKIIFPGVGEASSCMSSLKSSGLDLLIPTLSQPLLGICVGLQLMCNYSEEGQTKGLGIFNTAVKKFIAPRHLLPENETIKIPQMGWNTIFDLQTPLFQGIDEQSYIYYVHSYYAEVNGETIAKTHYTLDYAAAMHNKNFYAVQFHTEKSSKVGEQIVENFLKYC